jgi:hypothetical protein
MDVHGPSKKILLAGYVQSTEPGFSVQYFVAKADPTLQRPQIALTKLKSGLSSGAAPHASLLKVAGGNMVGLFVEGTGIRRRRINNFGTPVGPTSLFFTGSVQQVPLEFPITVYASQGNRSESAALGLDDSSQGAAKLWMQTTNSTGAATGQPLELRSNYTGVNPSAITQLPINSDTGFWYAVVIVEGAQLSEPPASTESSGLAILKVNTAP